MNTQKIARGWALIAEGAMELSLAYESIDSSAPGHGAGVDTGAAGASADSPPRSAAPADIPLKAQVDAGLGVCPIHGVPWTVKPAGVSPKTKKPYSAFWKCAERDDNGFCDERPQPIWKDNHPIRAGAAA